MKTNIILLVITALLFAGLIVAFPYTDMGKQYYEVNRNNAITYVIAYRHDTNPEIQREIDRLINKYDLEEYLETYDDIFQLESSDEIH